MLRFAQVGFTYGTQEASSIFEEVSFCVARKEFVGLTGPNGSGKSTLALLAAGILSPRKGRITVHEQPTAGADIGRFVGILFQDPIQQIFGQTVEEDIAFGLENIGLSKDAMDERILAACNDFKLSRSRKTSELSGGMAQRLAIAGLLAVQPAFLILDEPTSFLDPWDRQSFWNFLKDIQEKTQTGILLISQSPEELFQCSRLLVLFQGKIVFDGLSSGLWDRPELTEWGVTVPGDYLFEKFLQEKNLKRNHKSLGHD